VLSVLSVLLLVASLAICDVIVLGGTITFSWGM